MSLWTPNGYSEVNVLLPFPLFETLNERFSELHCRLSYNIPFDVHSCVCHTIVVKRKIAS